MFLFASEGVGMVLVLVLAASLSSEIAFFTLPDSSFAGLKN
jgi:hypothetical protein